MESVTDWSVHCKARQLPLKSNYRSFIAEHADAQ